MKLAKIVVAAAAALLLATPSAFAQEAQRQSPALFVARDADSALYLFGTLHIRRPGEAWGGPAAQAALSQAGEVWTELEISPTGDAQAQALALQYGLAEPERPLSSYFSEAENARIKAFARANGADPRMLDRMRPWMAAITLSILPMIRAGYDPSAGADRLIDGQADAAGKTMRWFETAEEQMRILASIDAEQARELVLQAIDEAENGGALMERMAQAWQHGDLETLQALVVDDMRAQYPEAYAILLAQRNAAWTPVLVRELEGSGVDFVAVGAAHLLGEDGLVAALRARGYAVERVE